MIEEIRIQKIELISPIELISTLKSKEILLNDLKKLLELINSNDFYFIEHFKFKNPLGDDEKIIKKYDSMVALAVWKESENINKIYFTDKYFNLGEKQRISYLFHEICHFLQYSLIKECKEILLEREKIDSLYQEESKNQNGIVSSQILIQKNGYAYMLTLFNEQLADRLMLSISSDLFKTKLNSNLNSTYEKIQSAHYLWHTYILLLDIKRSINILKNKQEYKDEIQKLEKLSRFAGKKLKEDSDFNRYTIFIEYENKFLDSYDLGYAKNTIKVFNEFIDKLTKC